MYCSVLIVYIFSTCGRVDGRDGLCTYDRWWSSAYRPSANDQSLIRQYVTAPPSHWKLVHPGLTVNEKILPPSLPHTSNDLLSIIGKIKKKILIVTCELVMQRLMDIQRLNCGWKWARSDRWRKRSRRKSCRGRSVIESPPVARRPLFTRRVVINRPRVAEMRTDKISCQILAIRINTRITNCIGAMFGAEPWRGA